jgi:hypothetical protein
MDLLYIMSVIENNNFYIFNCPHCNRDIEVEKKQLNCRIFRCGIYKNNFKQIGPHTNKSKCDRLVQEDLIYGCGKPFRFITKNGINSIEICGYI